MEAYEALKKADDVKTFPSIAMPPPTFRIHTGKTSYAKTKDLIEKYKRPKSQADPFPGLLKTKRSDLLSGQSSSDKGNVFTGYGLVSTKLDVTNETGSLYEAVRRENELQQYSPRGGQAKGMNQVDLTASLPAVVVPPKTGVRNDTTLEELRNYIVLMDQYSLHNFLIYEGKTLKDTPEFQSFQRTYQYKWGAISSIIYQLEEYMSKNDIKLAIINGPRVYELAKLNLPLLKKPELHSCIANIEQIELTGGFGTDVSRKQMIAMVVRIQSRIRTFLAIRRYKRRKRMLKSAIIIQSLLRLMLERARYRIKLRRKNANWEDKSYQIQEKFVNYWRRLSAIHQNKATPSSSCLTSAQPSPRTLAGQSKSAHLTFHSVSPRETHVQTTTSRSASSRGSPRVGDVPTDLPLISTNAAQAIASDASSNAFDELVFPYDPNQQKRLIILLPSIHASQFLRLEYENYAAVQNTLISNLYLLADENVHLIYVSPTLMTNYQVAYHEKFLALMGISTLPKRLTFITPELVEKLPPHLTLAQQLWCSTVALNRIRQHVRQVRNSYLICSSFTWAEKRIARYLNIPILGPDTTIAETISSRSWLKNFFFQSGVNYPIGSHDIYSLEELYLALTRLIAANLGIMRWNVKLNYDYNQESVAQVDVEKIPLVVELRSEQFTLVGEKDNTASWFSRPVQLAVRKRILTCLQKEFPSKVRLHRKDIFGSLDQYLRLLKLFGAVIEAEPIEKIGYLVSLIFISPLGEITLLGGVQEFCDDGYQVQAYAYPQTLTPPMALHGVSQELANRLFHEYRVTGYVNIRFLSLWDDLDQQPRLWATDIKFGVMAVHGALGTAALMTSTEPVALPFHLLPKMPEGRSFVYIPLAAHEGLKSSHDDAFFKLCRMRGIAFDTDNRIGTLFFLPDTVVGGTISAICMGRSRRKSLEIAVATINFVQRNYGMDSSAVNSRHAENLTKILSTLKRALKSESEEVPFSY